MSLKKTFLMGIAKFKNSKRWTLHTDRCSCKKGMCFSFQPFFWLICNWTKHINWNRLQCDILSFWLMINAKIYIALNSMRVILITTLFNGNVFSLYDNSNYSLHLLFNKLRIDQSMEFLPVWFWIKYLYKTSCKMATFLNIGFV